MNNFLRICELCGGVGVVLAGNFGGECKCPECEKRIEELSKIWKKYVFEKESEIDPEQEQLWYSMALGFALGNGELPDFSHKFAQYVIDNHIA